MIERSERDRYVADNKVDLLLAGLVTSMPATVLNSTMIMAVLWKVVPIYKLVVWFSLNVFFVILRYILIAYDKKNKNNYSLELRKTVILVSFIISGVLFGASGIFVGDIDQFEYVVFLYFVAGGMVVGSLGAYHNNLDVHFSYSGCVFILITLAVYLQHNTISNAMVILGCIFYATTSVTAVRLNKDLSESLILRFDNEKLVVNLNDQKRHTEKLNEELVRKNETLKELSLIDPLTGLKNRRYLFEIVTPEIDSANKKLVVERRSSYAVDGKVHKSYGILMIDIDHFKRVNDKYGHDSGDLVLKQFADKLVENVRADDIVGRTGGEEFIIILKEPTEVYLKELAINILTHIENSVFKITSSREIKLTCSMGFVFYPFFSACPGHISFEQLMSLADKALYFAKESGRNKAVNVTTTESDVTDSDIIKEIISDLYKSIENRQIGFEIVNE